MTFDIDRMRAILKYYGMRPSNDYPSHYLLNHVDRVSGYNSRSKSTDYVGLRIRRHMVHIDHVKVHRRQDYSFWLGGEGQQSL